MTGAAAARKTVTILFCDLVESTRLGEGLDPESLRDLLGRWHAVMREPVERNGGTVEKFIGDALMAVFGVPQRHEDDALRAVQAGVQMREALERLNADLHANGRSPLHIRIGINSGEVVAGDGATTLVTGDAVNTAKRLEEAAAPGEILIGDATRRLVANAALLERRDAVQAKGKAEPVDAWLILDTIAGANAFARRLDAPLIGRQGELAFLREELDRAARERSCRLVTVFGAAGIGKSRLAAELSAQARDHARVITTRCLPYGDGITFLPLAELVRSAGGQADVLATAANEPDGALIVERIHALLEADRVTASPEETLWAIRRLLESLARPRPLVVCIEDVHWATPMFLDLLEYIAAWCQDAPILLLCLARPDLLDERPRWPGAALSLEPLDDACSRALVEALEEEWPIPPELRTRIADAAEGNPLFVEQMVAMVSDTGEAEVVAPPTIHALLAARLDRLEPLERDVLERAAVAGREFSRSALAELSPADEVGTLATTLLSLVRKELLRPARTPKPGDDALRFSHALIRDAAYSEIPKASRAELHERFAGWLESDRGKPELVGYHLEQAFRCGAELGAPDDRIGERAARLLAGAGQRAHERGDVAATANLLGRALALADLGAERGELLRELASAQWRLGDVAATNDAIAEAIDRARSTGDVRLEWSSRLEEAARRRLLRAGNDDVIAVATEAIEVFTSLGDDAGLARAWRGLALASVTEWRFADAAAQAERALQHAVRAGDTTDDVALADTYCTALYYGPEPASAAAQRCRELLESFADSRMVRAVIVSSLAPLEAMQGAFDQARAHAEEAAEIFDDLGALMVRAGLAEVSADIERLAGDLNAAEDELRFAISVFHDAGSPALAALRSANLVGVLVEQQRLAEAERVLADVDAAIRHDDIDASVAHRVARAHVALARGRNDDARRLADEALEALRGTDALSVRAEVLAIRAAAAGEQPDEAIAVHEQKGNVAAVSRLRGVVNARAAR
ncbi:MAG TPA: adenylate/guanylate cyclase domain-containing protein [Gaiellaceae bacterium]|jgi:class 3 adenylate cyclase/tetratricopeptide (TPR) repeat protein